MSSKSGAWDFVLPHEPYYIIRHFWIIHLFSASIWCSDVSLVQYVDVSAVEELYETLITPYSGLVKKGIQFSTWSNISGKKMRVGASLTLALRCTPLSLTSLLPTVSGSKYGEVYFLWRCWLARTRICSRAVYAYYLIIVC